MPFIIITGQGLDQMYDHEFDARASSNECPDCTEQISILNFQISCSCNFSSRERRSEIGNVFKKGTPDEKSRALDLLTRIDVSNLNQYKQDLQ